MTAQHDAYDQDLQAHSAHETLHENASSSIDVYVELSRTYAAKGDARLALLALWAADVMVLQSLLWESGLGSAPDPDAQLAAVGRAVDGSLRSITSEPDGSPTVTSALQCARTAMMSSFDSSVHARLIERFHSPEHLSGLPLPAASAAQDSRLSRQGDRSSQQLAEDLRVAAADCMAVSTWMAHAGLPADALAQARLADLASFEAYLVEAATAVGDASLATVDLRWDIAASAVDGLTEVPEGLPQAVHQLREVLLGAVGPAEADALLATFEHIRSPAA
jgi:hypothetical protein